MNPDQLFVVALAGILAATAIAAQLVTGLIVWLVIRQLDRLVNGWAPPPDEDDGGHGDGGGGEDPPPPGGPSALALDPPRPSIWPSGMPPLLPPSLGYRNPGRPFERAGVAPASNRAAARLAANLRRMSGAATVEDLVALYADPLPGHPTSCGCGGCVHRMTDWYATAAVEDALARLLPSTEAGA